MSIPKEINSTLGERLKAIRLSNNFSTNKFADILGIAQSAITKIENGQSEPSTKTITSLIEKFGIDPLWLLTGTTKTKIESPTAMQIAEIADKLPEKSRQRILDLTRRELMLEEMLRDQQMKKAASD
ncbi:MAG: XRE family transcriptional regulator [Sphingobacteriia bacterium]|nr:XRE family transcriptional regulator [Sphingobacteriia bacterium]